MFTVVIDIPGLEKTTEYNATRIMQLAMQRLTAYATDRLTQLTDERMDAGNAKRYRDALQIKQQGPYQVVISLGDSKVEKMETGVPSFDIKPHLLRSAKAKQGKAGPYVDVPFKHTTSKRGSGQYLQSRHARGVVKALQQQALATGRRHVAFKGRWSPTSRWRRQADMRIIPRGRAGLEQLTFRRVSDKSPADSWIFPEQKGLGIFETVVEEIRGIQDEVVHRAIADVSPKMLRQDSK